MVFNKVNVLRGIHYREGLDSLREGFAKRNRFAIRFRGIASQEFGWIFPKGSPSLSLLSGLFSARIFRQESSSFSLSFFPSESGTESKTESGFFSGSEE